MTKDISPNFTSVYSSSNQQHAGTAREKYIDKGNLTSRECGRLVKGMIEDYEKKLMY